MVALSSTVDSIFPTTLDRILFLFFQALSIMSQMLGIPHNDKADGTKPMPLALANAVFRDAGVEVDSVPDL